MVRLCYKSIKEGMNQLKINKTKKIVLLFAFLKSTREKEKYYFKCKPKTSLFL